MPARDSIAWLVVIPLVAILSFCPFTSPGWAVADDFVAYETVLRSGGSLGDVGTAQGRPLATGLYDAIAPHLSGFTGLVAYHRLFLLTTTLFGLCLYVALRTVPLSPRSALLIAALATASPANLDIAPYTVAFCGPLWPALALLALLPGHFASGRPVSVRALAGFLSAGLLALSFSAYQPAPFVFVAVVSMRCWVRGARYLSQLVIDIVAFVLSAAVYGIVVFLPALNVGGSIASRAVIGGFSPVTKLAWFLAMPLRDALNLFFVFPRDPLLDWRAAHASADAALLSPIPIADIAFSPVFLMAASTAVFIVVGCVVVDPDAVGQRRWRLGLLMLTPPSCHALFLVLATRWSPFRTQLAMEVFVLFASVAAAAGFGRRLPVFSRFGAIGAVLVVSAAVVSMNLTARTWIVEPLRCELSTLTRTLATMTPQPRLQVMASAERAGTSPGLRYEMGRSTASTSWGIAPLVREAARSAHWPFQPEVEVVSKGGLQLGCDAGVQ